MISRFLITFVTLRRVDFPFICAYCVGNKIEINFFFTRRTRTRCKYKKAVLWFANSEYVDSVWGLRDTLINHDEANAMINSMAVNTN